MRRARGRFRVLSSLLVTSLLLVLFGSTVGAGSLSPTPQQAPHDYDAGLAAQVQPVLRGLMQAMLDWRP